MACVGFNGSATVAPIAPVAPNLSLTYVPTIQTPTQQAIATNGTINGSCTRKRRDWFDYAILFLAFIAVVNTLGRR